MEKLLNYIKNFIDVDNGLFNDLSGLFKYAVYSKGENILDAGKFCRNLYFINAGAIRTYYYQDGRDVTSWIYPENYFITAWSSFINNSLAFENIQAIAPTELYYIDKKDLETLYCKYPSMERFGRKLMEEQLAFVDEINYGFMFSSAKERYDNLLEIFPDITRVANLGHIASILGISQETLSRIRKLK